MNMRSYVFRFAITALVACSLASCEKPAVRAEREAGDLTSEKVISIDDRSFLLKAQKAAVWQTTLAQAALDISTNDDIRSYASQVIANYRNAFSDLTGLMKAKNIPWASVRAEELQLEAMNRLRGLSASAFDHEFISLMTAEQQATLADFNLASETAADPDIRNYAKRVVPLLREDFNTATTLEKKLRDAEAR